MLTLIQYNRYLSASLKLTKALALVGGSVHEHLRGDDRPKRQEHLHEFVITELLW